MNYIPSLAEIYQHPDNGKPDVFLAGFASKHNDSACFITQVGQNAGNKDKFVAYGLMFKWGYESSEKPVVLTLWDNDQMQREFSREFYTWYQMSEHRWSSGFCPMPLAFQEKCHFLPLKLHRVMFTHESITDDDKPILVQVNILALARNAAHIRLSLDLRYTIAHFYSYEVDMAVGNFWELDGLL